MVILQWTGENELTRTESVYLYAIAEIYATCSSPEKPLKNNEVAELMDTNYGLARVDEHVIARYKRLLEEVFGYQFVPSTKADPATGKPRVTRKGCYLKGIANSFDDNTLLTLCLMIKSNKTYGTELSSRLISNIREMASADRIKKLITTIRDIEAVDKGRTPKTEQQSMGFTDVLVTLLEAAKKRTQVLITCDSGLKEHYFKTKILLYPQCVFARDNEFYLLGTNYLSKNGRFLSHTYIHKIRHITSARETKNKEVDTHQKGDGTITNYFFHDAKTVAIKDLLNGMGEIREGLVYPGYFRTRETVFETDFMPVQRLKQTLLELKERYESNMSYRIKLYRSDTEGLAEETTLPNNRARMAAIIKIKAIEEEVFSIALRYRGEMSIVEPEAKKWFFHRLERLLPTTTIIYEAREKRRNK